MKRLYPVLSLLSLIFFVGCSQPTANQPVNGGSTSAPNAPPSANSAPTQAPSANSAPTQAPSVLPEEPSALPAPTQIPATVEPLPPTPTLAPIAQNEREAIFNEVWELVRDRYVYEDFNGVDWEAVRAELAPQVAAAESPAAFYEVMIGMINRLGDDHSRFETPQDVAEQEAEYEGQLKYGGIGAIVRETDEGGLILQLAEEGPAAEAGLRPRDLILAVDGVPFNDPEAFGPEGPIGRVRGEPGTVVRLTIQSPGQAPRDIEVVRRAIPTTAFPSVSSQRIGDGSVGYVVIDTFYVERVDELVREEIERMLGEGPLNGLVIDVRANSGGYVHLMRGTVGLFVDGGIIGSTSGRSESTEQVIPRGRVIGGTEDLPIVVLTSPDSASAAEMFAAGMQVLGRASVVGLPSAGNTENLYAYTFDDGSRLLLAEVAYRLPDGTLIEGRGVLPDREIDVEWWRYDLSDDPQIAAAIEELSSAQVGSRSRPTR